MSDVTMPGGWAGPANASRTGVHTVAGLIREPVRLFAARVRRPKWTHAGMDERTECQTPVRGQVEAHAARANARGRVALDDRVLPDHLVNDSLVPARRTDR